MFFRTHVFDDFDRYFRGFEGPRRLEDGSKTSVPAARTGFLRGLYPAVESFTRDGLLVLRAELPGVDRADVDVTVENGRLTLSGEKKFESERAEDETHVREIRYGRFERSFRLREGVKADDVVAKLDNGVLEISLPLEDQAKSRKIEISSGEKAA